MAFYVFDDGIYIHITNLQNEQVEVMLDEDKNKIRFEIDNIHNKSFDQGGVKVSRIDEYNFYNFLLELFNSKSGGSLSIFQKLKLKYNI